MLGDSIVKHGHSSLPLQTCIYFNWHYTYLYFLINLCLFTYKSVRFYYPSTYLGTFVVSIAPLIHITVSLTAEWHFFHVACEGWDIVIIFLYLIIDSARLLLVSKGNKVGLAVACIHNPPIYLTTLPTPLPLSPAAFLHTQTSTMRPLLFSWICAAPIIVLHAYYMSLQTYILRIDVVINALALTFVGLEVILSVLVFFTFFQTSRSF